MVTEALDSTNLDFLENTGFFASSSPVYNALQKFLTGSGISAHLSRYSQQAVVPLKFDFLG